MCPSITSKSKNVHIFCVGYNSYLPITFSLSSGVDSNVLLSAVDKNYDRDKINSLTLDFPNKINESELAKKNSINNNINHLSENINIDEIIELVLKYYNSMDMPTNDGLNNYLVSYYAKKNGSKILVSGIGGDEFFFGYPSFTRIPIIKKLSKFFPSKENIKNSLYSFVYKSLKKFKYNTKFAGLFKYNSNIFDAYMLQRCVFMPDEINDLINLIKLENNNQYIRAIAFRLYENNGILKRSEIEEVLKKIAKEDRKQFRVLGIKLGRYHVFLPKMLKPKAVELRILLWKFFNSTNINNEVPKSGLNFMTDENRNFNSRFLLLCGFEKFKNFYVRVDILEKLFIKIIEKSKNGKFETDSGMMNLLGCTKENFFQLMDLMKYKKDKSAKKDERAVASANR